MSARLQQASSSRVIATGIGSTIVALLVTFVIAGSIGSSRNASSQRIENNAILQVLARSVSGGSLGSLNQFRGLLGAENQRVTIVLHGHSTILGDPLVGVRDLATLSIPINGGMITIASPVDKSFDPPLEIVLLTLGVLLVVLGSGFVANRTVSRQTRNRVDEAVKAAERVSRGDFTARIGTGGPESIVRLGVAFDAMASRLESIDREQREFLADLAHEIATPIQALSGFSQAVIDGTIPFDVAQAAIVSQTARLSELLDELTQLRNLDAPSEDQSVEVDLYSLTHALYSEFGPIAAAAGIEMQFRGERISLVTEQKLIETVLRNFITNALRYTPPGERIVIKCELVNRRVVLSVCDTGPGIAAEHHQRIFDRFYRTAEARDRISGGTGLGLTIARRAAHSLGGHIELESELGRGSEFRLVVPLT